MKNAILLIVPIIFILTSCKKESELTETEKLLTAHGWVNDSLLINGEEASGPGEILEKFKGTTQFNEDGSGTVGSYDGTWYLANEEKTLTISADSLAIDVSANIELLNEKNLKITTLFPGSSLGEFLSVRMTFVAK